MKFAAIADIHGNCLALEAVLADIAALGITDVVNLGDHVSGPLEARRTADLLMARNFPSIQGDQDRRLVELWRRGPDASRRMDFQALEPRHFEWIASQPATMVWGGEVFLCHGTPQDDAAYWLDSVSETGLVGLAPVEAIEAKAAGIDASLILCAHSHIPRVVRMRDGRMVVNPGSVGLPGYEYANPVPHVVETGTPDACYAICEQRREGWSITIRHIPYNSAAMAEMARRNSLPAWASALATGWVR
jgi:predicted phosphodiesterase